jgi:hypothetical protein
MPLARDTDITSGQLRGVTGPLVKIPVNAMPFTSSGPSATLGSNPLNSDGSTANLPLSVPAGPGGGAWVTTNIAGTVVGVRWRRDAGAVSNGFDVIIDGVAYPVDTTNPRFNNVSQAVTDYEATYIVATGLPNATHTVTVALNADQAGGSTRVLNLLGWIAEQGRSYNPATPIPRSGTMSSVVTLGTAQSSVVYNTPIRTLWFRNTDTVPRIVTVTLPDLTTIIYQNTIAAGATVSLPLGGPTSPSGWKWQADAAAKVLAWTENV